MHIKSLFARPTSGFNLTIKLYLDGGNGTLVLLHSQDKIKGSFVAMFLESGKQNRESLTAILLKDNLNVLGL